MDLARDVIDGITSTVGKAVGGAVDSASNLVEGVVKGASGIVNVRLFTLFMLPKAPI